MELRRNTIQSCSWWRNLSTHLQNLIRANDPSACSFTYLAHLRWECYPGIWTNHPFLICVLIDVNWHSLVLAYHCALPQHHPSLCEYQCFAAKWLFILLCHFHEEMIGTLIGETWGRSLFLEWFEGYKLDESHQIFISSNHFLLTDRGNYYKSLISSNSFVESWYSFTRNSSRTVLSFNAKASDKLGRCT